MLRTAVLSLILLAMVAATLPAGEWLAEAALRRAAEQPTTRRHHSRAWWRRHRARLRRQRAAAAEQRRRRWALRNRPAEQAQNGPRLPLPNTASADALPAALPSSLVSIAAIEQQVAPPQLPTLTRPQQSPAQQPAGEQSNATVTTWSNVLAVSPAHSSPATTPPPATRPTAQTTARPAAQTNAQPVHAVQSQPTSSPALAHAQQQTPTRAANAVKAAPAAPRPAPPRLTSPLGPVTSVLSPAASPVVSASDPAPNFPAPPAKAATHTPSLAGRDPHKFSALPAPRNWLGVSSTLGGEYKFSLRAADGRQAGVAVWSHVNLAPQGALQGPADRRNRALAGVAHATLRRTVIDRMIQEGGWVVNDFEREIAGQRVFVVVAQSESNGQRRAWTYYFVELDGQLYSLSTTAQSEYADSVASEAEQTLSALAARHGNSSQAGRSN